MQAEGPCFNTFPGIMPFYSSNNESSHGPALPALPRFLRRQITSLCEQRTPCICTEHSILQSTFMSVNLLEPPRLVCVASIASLHFVSKETEAYSNEGARSR